MTHHLATLGDYKYLTYGLCMYESLLRSTKEDFKVHYLAMDEDSEKKLRELNLDHVVVYSLSDFSEDEDFLELKEKNKKGERHSPFHWMMSSFFSHYLINKFELPEVFYVDTDICFYGGFESISKSVENCSVGLITHKHVPLNKKIRNPGYYNVGVVYFSGDEYGKKCLDFWRSCCINPDNEHSDIFGACGDQKYLELFEDVIPPEKIKNICLDVGNMAPWNASMFDFLNDGSILWKDPSGIVIPGGGELKQDLIFYHFSHFVPDYEAGGYKMDWNGEWGGWIKNNPTIRKIYNDYYYFNVDIRKKYKL